jgi:hypothetical protein
MTYDIANNLTLRNNAEFTIKLLIAMHGNYGYLRAWTYLLKIYRKRFQFASKSIICNDAFPLFCEAHLKGQPAPLPLPLDATFRLLQERSLQQPPELVGQGREGAQEQLLPREEVTSHQPAEGSFRS